VKRQGGHTQATASRHLPTDRPLRWRRLRSILARGSNRSASGGQLHARPP